MITQKANSCNLEIMAEVSIIVPVYNVEEYMSFCLDSILNQTFHDIEIICVNDGSTDKSSFILERYADFDERIKIINRPNGGLSAARNTGIEAVNSEYILFVDSDDYVSPLLVENVLNIAKEYNPDFLSFNNFVFMQNTRKLYLSFCAVDNSLEDKLLTEKSLPASVLADIPLTAWSKLYKTKIIKDNNLKFVEGIQYEDGPWGYEYFCACKSFFLTNTPLYFYRAAREGSIMMKKDKSVMDVITSLKLGDEVMQKHGRFEKYKNTILRLNVDLILYHYNRLSGEVKEIYFNAAKEYFKSFMLYCGGHCELDDEKKNNYLELFLICSYQDFEKAVHNA